jgi:hypothetical protein
VISANRGKLTQAAESSRKNDALAPMNQTRKFRDAFRGVGPLHMFQNCCHDLVGAIGKVADLLESGFDDMEHKSGKM